MSKNPLRSERLAAEGIKKGGGWGGGRWGGHMAPTDIAPFFNKHPKRENPTHPGAVGNNFSSFSVVFFLFSFKLSLLAGSFFFFFFPLV